MLDGKNMNKLVQKKCEKSNKKCKNEQKTMNINMEVV